MQYRKPTLAALAILVLGTAGCGGSGVQGSVTPVPLVTTTPIPQEGLWVANGTNVLEFVPNELGPGNANPLVAPVTTPQTPVFTLSSASMNSAQGVVFDGSNDLWVVDAGEPAALEEFTAAQLASGSNLTPASLLTSSAFVAPRLAVFDSSGDLWLSDSGANAVFMFTAAQLAAGGPTSPTTTLTAGFNSPTGIAFDSSGNLWVSNTGASTVVGFDAANLPTTGIAALTPDAVLAGPFEGPWGLAFDDSGDLWVANSTPVPSIVEIDASDLTTGNPTPDITLNPTNVQGIPSLATPQSLAFNSVGDLAVADSASLALTVFNSAQLAQPGPTVPINLIVGTETRLSAPAGLTFGPFVP